MSRFIFGVIIQGVGEQQHGSVGEPHLIVNEEFVSVGVILTLMAEKCAIAAVAMPPLGVISCGSVALISKMVGQQLSTAIDEHHGIVPYIDHSTVAIVEKVVAIDKSGVGELDCDTAEGCETVFTGVVVCRIRPQYHSVVTGRHSTIQNPDITVVRVTRPHA